MAEYHNRAIICFVRSDKTAQRESVIVYLKQSDEDSEYAVKVMIGQARTIKLKTHSLSSALRELAETIAQFTNGFSTWSELV